MKPFFTLQIMKNKIFYDDRDKNSLIQNKKSFRQNVLRHSQKVKKRFLL